ARRGSASLTVPLTLPFAVLCRRARGFARVVSGRAGEGSEPPAITAADGRTKDGIVTGRTATVGGGYATPRPIATYRGGVVEGSQPITGTVMSLRRRSGIHARHVRSV